jgi:hypothetical protein
MKKVVSFLLLISIALSGIAQDSAITACNGKNRYQKDTVTEQKNDKKVQNVAQKETSTQSQPVGLWLVGGFIIAVILYFLIGRKKKDETERPFQR